MRATLVVISGLLLIACTQSADNEGSVMTRPPVDGPTASDRSAIAILASYAEAWRGDAEFKLHSPLTLGIWIDGEGFTVKLTNNGGEFTPMTPAQFDFGFVTDLQTLRQIDAGNLNVLTAMGQARASDPIPLELRLPEDFSGNDDIRSYYIPLTLHFWNREWPETIRFGEGTTRSVHGANTTVLIYDQGLRTAWYQLKASMHINADPADQINDFDSAIVVTRGRFGGRIDGVERVFREGETVLVPAGTSHEFYAGDDEYGEFIIVMWGDNA